MDSDDRPDSPVGSKQHRITKAIHWHFTTDLTHAEIADRLGVREETVSRYIREPPVEEVRDQLQQQTLKTRLVAFEELKRQLREAGQRSRSAECPVKIWPEDGAIHVTDIRNDHGKLLERIPIPEDFELGPDQEERFYGRNEAREILEMMVDLVGAGEPDTLRLEGGVNVEHAGAVQHSGSLSIRFEPTALEEDIDDGGE
jgi:predicted DNA-binding protein YlxM (UPF0122 family)